MRRRILLSSSGGIDPTAGRKKIGNYEVVDLGLPSGLLWATCNVGANIETGYGNHYQWGAGAVTYKNENQYHTGGSDSSYTLPSSADTATQVMGNGWRMPTLAEQQELVNNTTYSGTTINGGMSANILISKTNPKAYVLFPVVGFYSDGKLEYKDVYGFIWSSTSNSRYNAYYLGLKGVGVGSGGGVEVNRYGPIFNGCSVRGVHAAV